MPNLIFWVHQLRSRSHSPHQATWVQGGLRREAQVDGCWSRWSGSWQRAWSGQRQAEVGAMGRACGAWTPWYISAVPPQPEAHGKRSSRTGPHSTEGLEGGGDQHLTKRDVILHTDGARAYTLKIPGVIHDHVVHKKRCVVVKGKTTWMKPRYTKNFKHQLPGGKTVMVKGGTQIIDRFWGLLRQGLKHIIRTPGSSLLERKVRSVQWIYWHRSCNMWQATGSMIKSIMKLV